MFYKSIIAVLLATSISAASMAQEKEATAPKKQKEEDIIIRKKGNVNNERLIISIYGDSVTINGKPADEFKSEGIDVIKREDLANLKSRIMTQMPPFAVHWNGGMSGNKALLGVVTEKADGGAKITSVSKESAAEKAGLKAGDIMTKINDKKIEGSDDLVDAIGSYKPADKITVTYLRNGKENTTSATLGKNNAEDFAKEFKFNDRDFNFKMPPMPDFKNFEFNYSPKPRLGLQIQDVESGSGVKVLDVMDGTAAAKAGLKKDDVIIEANGKAVNNVDDLRSHLKDVKEGDMLKLKYRRDNKTQTAEIKFPKRIKTANL
jgi:serine protease Do